MSQEEFSVSPHSFVARYRNFFSIQEIEKEKVLQWAFGALLFALFVTFSSWADLGTVSRSTAHTGNATCWSYFQNCDFLYVLDSLPSYSQTTFYALIFGIMLLVVHFMSRREWTYAHMGILVLYLWKVFSVFVLSFALAANYDYYDIFLGAVILFFPHKTAFTKIVFVLLYFLASTIKFHEGWIAASYFTSLTGGMPWISGALAPLASNIVIAEQTIGAWFLLSRKPAVQRTALAFFIFFHLYSIIFVTYRYPSTALTMLLVLFGPQFKHTPLPLDRKAIAGWTLIVLLFAFQFVAKVVPGDQKMTLEANQFGLNMFEANHQCRSVINYELSDGKHFEVIGESEKAWNRCNPYVLWLRIHNYCTRAGVVRARWTFDHSVNGHPFYRMVDVENACELSYTTLEHNTWIRTPEEGAPVVGRPLQNPYTPKY